MSPDVAVYLGTVAALVFAVKSTILFNVRIRDQVSQTFVVLCLFFVVQNAFEFLGYFTYLKSEAVSEVFVHLYMVSLFYIFPSLLIFPFALTKSRWFTKVRTVAYCLSVLSTFVYLSGNVVDGFKFVGWTVIAEPGPAYWPVMGYNLACCLGFFVYLVYQLYFNKHPEIRRNVKVTLIATAPIVTVAVGVIGLRLLGFDSSSAVSLPIATLIFLYIILVHTTGDMFWLSTKLKSILVLLKMNHNTSIDEIIRELEKVRIQEALKLANGQQKAAAKQLGVSASTLSKRLSKYNIDVTAYKS